VRELWGADPGLFYRAAFGVPWLQPDPAAALYNVSPQGRPFELPPGVNPRYRGSPLYPLQIPDLIALKPGGTWTAPGFNATALLAISCATLR